MCFKSSEIYAFSAPFPRRITLSDFCLENPDFILRSNKMDVFHDYICRNFLLCIWQVINKIFYDILTIIFLFLDAKYV